jgi:mRNA interferase MazF
MVALDPTRGHEVRKTRPTVVVTDDLYNEYNWVVLVVPLSSEPIAQRDQVLILPPDGGLSNPSVLLPDQMRAIDRRRLVRHLGRLAPATMSQVELSLRIVLALG